MGGKSEASRQYGWEFLICLCIPVPFSASRIGGEGQLWLGHGGLVYIPVIKIADVIVV